MRTLRQLFERIHELEAEKRALATALKREREHTRVEARRADALETRSAVAWRVASLGRRPETPS
jgi:hypothetical protein